MCGASRQQLLSCCRPTPFGALQHGGVDGTPEQLYVVPAVAD
jgi:hypothetical protein